MFLENILSTLPGQLVETIVYIVAALGAIIITYGVFLEVERRQDLILFTGAACLFVYALYIDNKIFMVATGGFGIAALIEFIEILVGLHKHGPEDLKRYKKLR